MKTLKVLQTLAKIGKIFSKIIFICTIVGACACAVGIPVLALFAKYGSIQGEPFADVFRRESENSLGTAYTVMLVGLVLCVGEAWLAKIAERYFAREIADGTPFTFSGAKALFRLGIWTICLSVGTVAVAQITQSVAAKLLSDVEKLSLDIGSVGTGIAFLVCSLFCKAGAEYAEIARNNEQTPDEAQHTNESAEGDDEA